MINGGSFMKQGPMIKYLFYIGVVASVTQAGYAAEPKHHRDVSQAGAVRTVEGGALSLARAIRLAMEHNPDLRASGARKEAAAGRALQARAWPNPELEVFSQDMPVERSRMSQAKHMAGITQTIPYPGKKHADIEIGNADAAVGSAAWLMHRAGLVREVKIAYCHVQIAERMAAVTEDLLTVAQAAAAAAAKRSSAGEIPLQEQLRAEIQLEQTQAEKENASRETAEARLELSLLLGHSDILESNLTDQPNESIDPALTHRAPSVWLDDHPAMVAARARRKQAVATLQRAGLDPLPDVKVGLAGGRDEAAEENLMELRFSLPLPLFDRNKGKQIESLAGVREADAEIAATEQRLIAEWRAATARYQAAAQQVTAHRDRILPKSEQALRLVLSGFESGKFGYIELLDMQRTTAESRMIYQKKLFELNSAQAEIESITQPPPSNLH